MRTLFVFSAIMLLCYGGRSLILHVTGYPAAKVESEPPVPQTSVPKKEAPAVVPEAIPEQDVATLLAYARSLEGAPYRAAGQTPAGFDCSGFVQHVFAHSLNQKLPRSSRAQARVGTAIDLGDIQPGDLLFFKGSNLDTDEIGHVALVLSAAPTRLEMIHSSSSRGIVVEDMYRLAYYRERYVSARRVAEN